MSNYGPPPGYGPPPSVQHVVHSYAQPHGWRCPYCGFMGNPGRYTKVSTGGWIWFVILFFSFACTLICWIPLLMMRDTHTQCPQCRTKIS